MINTNYMAEQPPFSPEEDPMPEIERAYNMLMDIYNKAQRKAATLRKRGSR